MASKLLKHFSDLHLNAEQKDCLLQIGKFLSSTSDDVFLLKGYAGTGKTTLLKGIIDYLLEQNRFGAAMASTGRAAQILNTALSSEDHKAKTIHSTIYNLSRIVRIYVRRTKEESDMAAIFSFELKQSIDTADQVYIIDEASMIPNKKDENETLRFGSGRLLSDLLHYVDIHNTKANRKIIFVGDPAQLPPVIESDSPALQTETFAKQDLICKEFKLTRVIRQDLNSHLSTQILKLRSQIEDKIYFYYGLTQGEDLKEVSESFAIQEYVKRKKQKTSTTCITYTNRLALHYNQAIRSALNYPPNRPVSGDQMLVIKNQLKSGIPLKNGEVVRLVEVFPEESRKLHRRVSIGDKKQMVTLSFLKVRLAISNAPTERFIDSYIIGDLLDSPFRGLSPFQQRALFIDAVVRLRNKNIAENHPLFSDALIEDPLYNALQLKYGYAITCHKAQGGEWDHLIIDFRDRHSANKDTIRWAYTALTRARKKVLTLNSPSWSWRNHFKSSHIITSKKKLPHFPRAGLLPRAVKNEIPPACLNAWSQILAPLKNNDWVLTRIQEISGYHQIAHIEIQGIGRLIIRQYFNKKQEATSQTLSGDSAAISFFQQLPFKTSLPDPLTKNAIVNKWLHPLIKQLMKKFEIQTLGIDGRQINVGHKAYLILKTDVDGSYLTLHINRESQLTTIQPHSPLGNADRKLKNFIEKC